MRHDSFIVSNKLHCCLFVCFSTIIYGRAVNMLGTQWTEVRWTLTEMLCTCYTNVETILAPMFFFYETQMPPEPLPMGNLSWNLSTFQIRQLWNFFEGKWGGVFQLTFFAISYKLVHCNHFCTCRSLASIMFPIRMHSTQSNLLT
jgi:hypothetical protein